MPFGWHVDRLAERGLRYVSITSPGYGGSDDDIAFTRPWGFDPATIPGTVHLWQGAHDRMVPYAHGQWLAAHCGGACVHLSDDQGHLSLVRDRFGDIIDELVGTAG